MICMFSLDFNVILSMLVTREKEVDMWSIIHINYVSSCVISTTAEQYAIATGQHPEKTTQENSEKYKSQLKNLGLCFDWDREFKTSDSKYYKWTQWMFSKLFNSYYCI